VPIKDVDGLLELVGGAHQRCGRIIGVGGQCPPYKNGKGSVVTELTTKQKELITALGTPLSITDRPFAEMADSVGMDESEVIRQVRCWLEDGTIRRFGARVNHRKIGYMSNGMSVWKVTEENIEEVGNLMARFSEVSHCYRRKAAPGWEYNLYAMIHGLTEKEVLEVAELISERTGINEYEVLFSTRELKKCPPSISFRQDDVVSE